MNTHKIRITAVDPQRTDEYPDEPDDVEWAVEYCPGCNLWGQCVECWKTYDHDTLAGMFYDSDDYPDLVIHGENHTWNEGMATVPTPGCGLDLDGGVTAIQEWIWYEQEHHKRQFAVGEEILLDAIYEGDGYWWVGEPKEEEV